MKAPAWADSPLARWLRIFQRIVLASAVAVVGGAAASIVSGSEWPVLITSLSGVVIVVAGGLVTELMARKNIRLIDREYAEYLREEGEL